MLLAVLEARCGLNFSSAEVYLNVAGGYRLADPAADLAVAAALVSALAESLCRARPCGLAKSLWRGKYARWPMLA
jgi:predicted ATP-dependent serine protease